MKVLLVTGSLPPDVCGTAEYTQRLSESLSRLGICVEILHKGPWTLRHLPPLLHQIANLRPDLIHMQYPTTGYGHTLGPQGIALSRPLIVTLHEASQSHWLRQMSLYPFLVKSRHFIFTNEFEQQHVTRLAPWIAKRSSVIPIGNNLEIVKGVTKLTKTLTYFGIVRPDKGLEDVLTTARLLRERGCDVDVRIVGAVMPRWIRYYERLREESDLTVQWHVGFEDHAVAEMLAEARLAYLPFPDGASERRSSLITLLMNGCCVLTTTGPHTPDSMRNCVVPVASPDEAATAVEDMLRDDSEVKRLSEAAAVYAGRFNWDRIAQEHKAVYERTLCEG